MTIDQTVAITLGIATLIMGIFFVLRSLDSFKDWRDGNQDELWYFLSLAVGAAASILLAIALIPWSFTGSSLINLLFFVLPTFLILGLAAIALRTVYMILKWRKLD